MIKLPFNARSFDAGRNNPALLIHVQISGIRTGIIVSGTVLDDDTNVFFWNGYVIVDVVSNDDDRIARMVVFDVRKHSTVLPYRVYDFVSTDLSERKTKIVEYIK